jgi:acyl CoA:acetate/3-ketoacid CoA transferase alpha subunit
LLGAVGLVLVWQACWSALQVLVEIAPGIVALAAMAGLRLLALLRAERADRFGNLQYHGAQANFGPAMATAATLTVAEVKELLSEGALPPQQVGTPGIYVNRVLALPDLRT